LSATPIPDNIRPTVYPREGVDDSTMLQQALALANRCVQADIEGECYRQMLDGRHWYDVRPMLDAGIHPPAVIKMNSEAIAFALQSALYGQHPERPYLLSLLTPEEATR
jgi:hypothetical protein